MARKPAPVGLTGGEGFEFEDPVAAWFLVNLLTGRTPFEPELGQVVQVHWQARDLGWLLEDLLIKLEYRKIDHSVALSIKSDRQVTKNGFPSSFVHDIWEQWLGADPNPFQKGKDLFVLAVGDLADGVARAWSQLLQEALPTDPQGLVRRLSVQGMSSALKRELFDSLHCPEDLQRGQLTSGEVTAELLRHIRLCRFDFNSSPSSKLSDALAIARGAVQSGQAEEALNLWNRLLEFSAARRTKGGTAGLPEILKIQDLPQLRLHPDFREDSDRLEEVSREVIESVSDVIGGHVTLARKSLQESTTEALSRHKMCILLGPSGAGKSVLAKRVCKSAEAPVQCLWFRAADIDEVGHETAERRLGLRFPVSRLLSVLPESNGIIVFDGLDRLSTEGLECVAKLLAITQSNPKWRAILTSTVEGWGRTAKCLTKAGVQISTDAVVQVALLGKDDMLEVARQLPVISTYLGRPELNPFLRNPKILDWIAEDVCEDRATASTAVADMPALVEVLWSRWVRTGHNKHTRSEVLKGVAAIEGESLRTGVPIGVVSDYEVLAELEDDHIVEVQFERVHFRHDLIGDWSRLYVLIEHREEAAAFLVERSKHPRWHYAIQLFGQWLLCCDHKGTIGWSGLLASLQDTQQGNLTQDLLLESVVLATNSASLLGQAWNILVEDDGRLLQRLLRRFLHVATFPDPRVEQLATAGERVALRATFRIPFWPLWFPVLDFLEKHAEEVVRIAGDAMAELCTLWLTRTPLWLNDTTRFPNRLAAARLAVMTARECQGRQAENMYVPSESEKEAAWNALLAAAYDLPADVVEVALELAGRREISPEITARAQAAEQRRREETAKRLAAETDEQRSRREEWHKSFSFRPAFAEGRMLPPWPDGPSKRIEESFRKTCLGPHGLLPLFGADPRHAAEILLAACIRSPHREDRSRSYDLIEDHETWGWHDGSRPMFFRGPFLNLLRSHPVEGLEVIIRLVNFATERWKEWDEGLQQRLDTPSPDRERSVGILFGGEERRWLGDLRVYGWYRDRFGSARVVVAALMALEKWLYGLLDGGEDITQWIDSILSESRSVAIAGVLAAVAKKKTDLLSGLLRPLMSIWEIYEWEGQLLQEELTASNGQLRMMLWARHDEDTFNLVRDWHQLPHRKVNFQNEAIRQLLSEPTVQDWFQQVREFWSAQLAGCRQREGLEILIARFDPRNYFRRREGDAVYLEFRWPASLHEKTTAAAEEARQAIEWLSFPIRCRRILDGEEQLETKNAGVFWDKLVELASPNAMPEDISGATTKADIACGGIAVLLRYHRDWLSASDERMEWIIAQLRQVAESPTPTERWSTPASIGSHYEDCFWAESVIMLLCEDQNSDAFRRWAAKAIMQFRYEATEVALLTASRERDRLGDDLGRLVNLSIVWAGLRALVAYAERLDQKQDAYLRWATRAQEMFVYRRLPGERLLNISKASDIANRIMDRMRMRKRIRFKGGDETGGSIEGERKNAAARGMVARRRRHHNWPGLDTEVLGASLSVATPLTALGCHRSLQIELVRGTLHLVTSCLQPAKGEEGLEIQGTPNALDRRVFDVIARTLPHLLESERRSELYQPILDLGPSAHYWIENFLTSWLVGGLQASPNPETFFQIWREMILYAFEHPDWRQGQSRSSFHLDDIWATMMGLRLGGSSLRGRGDLVPYIEKMEPLYSKWADTWSCDPRSMRDFAGFLTDPVAAGLLLPGLTWLGRAGKEIARRGRDFRDLRGVLASVCSHCWENCRRDIEQQPDLKKAFLDLLALLVEFQQPEALQLRDEVLRNPPPGD